MRTGGWDEMLRAPWMSSRVMKWFHKDSLGFMLLPHIFRLTQWDPPGGAAPKDPQSSQGLGGAAAAGEPSRCVCVFADVATQEESGEAHNTETMSGRKAIVPQLRTSRNRGWNPSGSLRGRLGGLS